MTYVAFEAFDFQDVWAKLVAAGASSCSECAFCHSTTALCRFRHLHVSYSLCRAYYRLCVPLSPPPSLTLFLDVMPNVENQCVDIEVFFGDGGGGARSFVPAAYSKRYDTWQYIVSGLCALGITACALV